MKPMVINEKHGFKWGRQQISTLPKRGNLVKYGVLT